LKGKEPKPKFPFCAASIFPKNPGAVGEDCLSAQREFRSRPDFSENRGKPVGPVRWGGFLWILFFVRTKKVSRLPGGPGT
jgi:hypothetical protein